MAFCRYCGNSVKEEDRFCNNCGARVEVENVQSNEQEYTSTYTEPVKEVSKRNSILSMIFSIVGISLSVFSIYPIIGFMFAIPSIIFTAVAKGKRNSYVREAGQDNGFSRAGSIVSTVAIPLIIVFSIFGLLLTVGLFSEL